MNISLKDIDDLKNHLADSLRGDLAKVLEPLIHKVDAVEKRISSVESTQGAQAEVVSKLKANQAKALVGWTALVAGVTSITTAVVAYAHTWFASKFNFHP